MQAIQAVSLRVIYNMGGQPVDRDPPVDLCMPGSRSRAESGFSICMTSLGNSSVFPVHVTRPGREDFFFALQIRLGREDLFCSSNASGP